MTAAQARKKDDWQQDDENPIIPFRMSDRLEMYRIRLLLYAALFFAATGPWAGAIVGHVMAMRP